MNSTVTTRSLSRRIKLFLFDESFWLGLGGTVFVFLAWEIFGRSGLVNPRFTSYPTEVFAALGRMIEKGTLQADLMVSSYEFIMGLSIAIAISIPLGFMMGWYRRIEYLFEPFIWFLYSTPKVALYPLFILWLGLGTKTIITVTTLSAIFPIVVNTWRGVKNVNPVLVRAARSFGANDWHMFSKITLPGSLPMVIAGLRLGVGRALIGVVVGEIFGGQAGLGYRIHYSASYVRTADMLAAILVVMLLGLTSSVVLKRIEAVATRR